MFIFMILHYFCVLHAQFCYIIEYKWKVESCEQIVDQSVPWKISSAVENLVLQVLQF
jgi:hypothetical protein